MILESEGKLKPVIIRSYYAGVHFGYLRHRDGKEVTLANSRRIWRWYGAWTLSEIATTGIDQSRSKVAATVAEITITDAYEIIACAPEAVSSIEGAKWRE